MNNRLLYIGADTHGLEAARRYLETTSCPIASAPTKEVTHLLLNIPTFTPDGNLAGGGDLNHILESLSPAVTVIGGNMRDPILQGYPTIDLLRNESYLAHNAAITAECALQLAYNHYPDTIRGTPILILGWGRIGKCLAQLLQAIGAEVAVAARKETDIGMIAALGHQAVPLHTITARLPRYRIIFNTVPYMILPELLALQCRADCLKIDLASVPGIGGSNVIPARGLPGKLMPEAAGRLIAATVLDLIKEKEVIP